MDYLFLKLIWWIVLAFAIGLLVGWTSCGQDETLR
jgi:Na+/H+-dicarboxylate symporter